MPVLDPAAEVVALNLQTTGIHPCSSRVVGLDALIFRPDSSEKYHLVQEYHQVVNPAQGDDPGPTHLHGLTPSDVAQAPGFSRVLRDIDQILDGRVIICHDSASTWGFICTEARRAMSAAARANRSRRRHRNRHRRKVGHIPRIQGLVDLGENAHRQGIHLADARLRALAAELGIQTGPVSATAERSTQSPIDTARDLTTLTWQVFEALSMNRPLRVTPPEDLCADQFGLQRSIMRVEAANAETSVDNPGSYQPGGELAPGMEVVIAPEIELNPDELISELLNKGLTYSEKLTRSTSLVVCNKTRDLRGKAMHAQRKDIPLMGDTAFLAALHRMPPPESHSAS
ncbi:DNA polymerase III subunit epsilon [Corynebacterium poyangense]|uniref:DNA polymerase III subunit epsilon n=1 Tax=Corynebacterium poyangense TaxID=2684405 RepID=A0A7H0SLJ4_9CORY|nr:DNA polymerase III subunit epsilon [Corynebacterium poyangense]QNQ89419.1 DNA polymerase III subunit epsilon [Corynebacterium poyangense]